MSSFNKVILAGNVTRDPTTKQVGNSSLAEFGLAINRKYTKDGKTAEEVTFVDCSAWGKVAEIIGEYVKKGARLLVDGRLKLDQWSDKTSGEKRSKLSVVVENVQMLDKRADRPADSGGEQANKTASSNAGGSTWDSGSDDIPF